MTWGMVCTRLFPNITKNSGLSSSNRSIGCKVGQQGNKVQVEVWVPLPPKPRAGPNRNTNSSEERKAAVSVNQTGQSTQKRAGNRNNQPILAGPHGLQAPEPAWRRYRAISERTATIMPPKTESTSMTAALSRCISRARNQLFKRCGSR